MTAAYRPDRDRVLLRGQPLASTEIATLYWVSEGRTNQQIGREFGITEEAVKTRMRRILMKLDAVDRAHAVRRGFEAGYLRPDLRSHLGGVA